MFTKLMAALAGGLWQYLLIALGVATAGLGVAYVLRGAQLTDARADVKMLELDLRQAKITIAGYQDAVRLCNEGTARLKAESEQKAIAAGKAQLQAQQEARKYEAANKRRAVLLAAPTPPGAGCREALVDLRRSLK